MLQDILWPHTGQYTPKSGMRCEQSGQVRVRGPFDASRTTTNTQPPTKTENSPRRTKIMTSSASPMLRTASE